MRLEDEIKTRQFRSEGNKLSVNIIYTFGWMMNRNNKLFQRYGLTMQQYNILRILRGQFPQPCNMQLLKDRMLDKQSDVSRLVDRLHQKALIERNTSATDRRKLDIVISQKGLDLLKEMDPMAAAMDDSFNALTEEEMVEANRLLDLIRDSKPL